MATLQERLQIKRVPIDKWSIKEQLCLASAVVRSGDQNWMSVSRALKQFAEPNRPPDWFSQKNCAAQYGSLLEHVETPKRKKRTSSGNETVEIPGESILKRLIQDRKVELRKEMEDKKREYLKLKEDMSIIKTASDGTIEKMCKEIEDEEKQKEQDAIAHSQLLKLREERKLEMDRVFRPMGNKVLNPLAGQKRKASESLELPSVDTSDEVPVPEPSKPALSPLLTSLLKTPSHVPNVTSSILHSAITNQRTSPSASPTIASLLNTTASVPVSQSLQQLVSTAIAKEPISTIPPLITISNTPKVFPPKVLPIVPNLDIVKVEEIKQEIEVIEEEKEVLEPKIEEVAVEPEKETETIEEEVIEEKVEPEIKSENEDTIESIEPKEEPKTEEPTPEEPVQEPLDIYDFDNNSKTSSEEVKDAILDSQDTGPDTNDDNTVETNPPEEEIKKESSSPSIDEKSKDYEPGSVEVVEIVVMEDDDSDKEMNKKVSEIKREIIREKEEKSELIYTQKEEPKQVVQKETTVYDEYDFDDLKKSEEKEEKPQDDAEFSRKSTFTPEYTETFFDDMTIEVTKLDKTGKAKRDYSRTRKKEEKDIDILLAVEKAGTASFEENEVLEETGSEKDSQDSDKKSDSSKTKIKDSTERSNSPWTEEEEVLPKTKRRLSATPATPIDSIPNSPASGTAIFDDDRDYRTWKKSVMLVYSRLAGHKNASLFLKPITDEQAPGYHGLIYRPMDLTTIRRNIENGHIRTTTEFQRDVFLMFNNAVMYNKSDETVYNMALQMQAEGLNQIQILLQAQTEAETPVRRETRTSESGLKRKRGQDELILKNKKRRDE